MFGAVTPETYGQNLCAWSEETNEPLSLDACEVMDVEVEKGHESWDSECGTRRNGKVETERGEEWETRKGRGVDDAGSEERCRSLWVLFSSRASDAPKEIRAMMPSISEFVFMCD